MAKDKYPYCTVHDKYAYATNGEAAASACRVVTYRKNFSLRIYPCSIMNGAWHLTKRV